MKNRLPQHSEACFLEDVNCDPAKDHFNHGVYGASVARVTNYSRMDLGWPHVVVPWLQMQWGNGNVLVAMGGKRPTIFLNGALAPLANRLVT